MRMPNDPTTLRELLSDLRSLPFGLPDKPDPWQNLTDMLELLAVAAGTKPAHLQGQGFRSEAVIHGLEAVAPRYGLCCLRTPALRNYRHRHPDYDPKIIVWEDRRTAAEQALAPGLLWVYADRELEAAIREAVSGVRSVAAILGYPDCCTLRNSEVQIAIAEAYVRRLFEQYRISTSEECIRLQENNAPVDALLPPDVGEDTLWRFPYTQVRACADCLRDAASPAARVNRRMRDLAFDVNPSFGKAIWRARDRVATKGRTRALGRNDPCSCGSGGKYKKCCALLPD
jgi:hypothetical protein